jgi:polyisoprenoid-binding protein YceI
MKQTYNPTARTLLGVLLLAAALGAGRAAAEPVEFRVEAGRKFNQVRFHSEATIESFDGKTNSVVAELRLDPAELEGATAEVRVDLRELDTGLKLRNKHMRENHLHTDRFPETSYRMRGLLAESPRALIPGAPVAVRTLGDYALHGQSREREMVIETTWFPDGRGTPAGVEAAVLHLVCRFDVALADHEIPRPEFLFMKVAETIQVEVDLWAVAQ